MAYQHKYICIHGHFYQPPRENAWLETVEKQESAYPWHNWNERINEECYAPNAAARILNEHRQITKIRNNYNRISFNFGATLLSWMEENDPEAYKLIQMADVKSAARFGGHGSALAQVHSHLILPLATYRDKVTQVFWGVRDFEYRFGRYPAGMWLAETAVDVETLEVLAAQGIQFTILAPRQAKSIRKEGSEDWHSVHADSIDTRIPYWCNLPSGRRIALFFYDGRIAQDVAFKGLLNTGKGFAQRLTGVFDRDDSPQISHIATDGESYGHHHKHGEMALADCLNTIEDVGLAKLINYGQFLDLFPPTREAQIHDNSSWSCVHGVERWRENCGCNSGKEGWHQKWRKPLREALDWLCSEINPVFEREAGRFLQDPWLARNQYIDVLLNKNSAGAQQIFFAKCAKRPLSALEKTQTLRLMEMQRQLLFMYTSCGWFFDEISGIETNQILQYALRALDYAQDACGLKLHEGFKERLALAPSNVYQNGAISFEQNVEPARVTLERVAMHFAVSSLFEKNPQGLDLFNYVASVEAFEKAMGGTQRFAVGRLNIRSKITQAEKTFSFAVLYLGQQHLIGNISQLMPKNRFAEMQDRSMKSFKSGHIGELIGIQQEFFGPEKFTLNSLFTDERGEIIADIAEQNLSAAESNFRAVYNENYQLMNALIDNRIPIPSAWRQVSAFILNADLLHFFEHGQTDNNLGHLKQIALDLKRWQIKLNDEKAIEKAATERIFLEINKLDRDQSNIAAINWLCDVLEILKEMGIEANIWRSQNVFYLLTKGHRKGLWQFINKDWQGAFERLASLLKVSI